MVDVAAIYTVGGSVAAGQGVYIARPADETLLRLCHEHTFAYVLAPRQFGKSSLMLRTAARLEEADVRTVIVDLTRIGTQVTAESWYFGLLYDIHKRLHLQTPLAPWWAAQAGLGLTQRLTLYFEDVVLREVAAPLVVFVDEIDTTLSLPFTDDFYAAIRAFYDERARVPAFARLSFVLVGVATPSDLVHDAKRTPFNIGQRVDMTDFTAQEAWPLTAGWGLPEAAARQVLGWVLAWTGGHPYLTQRLGQALAEAGPRPWTATEVDRVVARIFLGEESTRDNNLQFVRDMLTRRAPDPVAVLTTYEAIWQGRPPVPDETQSPVKSHLKLAGVARREQAALRVHNRLYRTVFDRDWIREQLPINWVARLRRVRVLLLASVGLSALLLLLLVFALYNAQLAENARKTIEQDRATLSQAYRSLDEIRLTEISQRSTAVVDVLSGANKQATEASLAASQQQIAVEEANARVAAFADDARAAQLDQIGLIAQTTAEANSRQFGVPGPAQATVTAAAAEQAVAQEAARQARATVAALGAQRESALATAQVEQGTATAQAQAQATAVAQLQATPLPAPSPGVSTATAGPSLGATAGPDIAKTAEAAAGATVAAGAQKLADSTHTATAVEGAVSATAAALANAQRTAGAGLTLTVALARATATAQTALVLQAIAQTATAQAAAGQATAAAGRQTATRQTVVAAQATTTGQAVAAQATTGQAAAQATTTGQAVAAQATTTRQAAIQATTAQAVAAQATTTGQAIAAQATATAQAALQATGTAQAALQATGTTQAAGAQTATAQAGAATAVAVATAHEVETQVAAQTRTVVALLLTATSTSLTPCAIPLTGGFNQRYRQYPELAAHLGCPTAAEANVPDAVDQVFQHGYMFRHGGTHQVYVVYDGPLSQWKRFPDSGNAGDPTPTELIPPAGLFPPEGALAQVWRAQLLAGPLGWGRNRTDFHPLNESSWQPFTHGLMIWTATAGYHALFDDGTWQYFAPDSPIPPIPHSP